ncbi:MAG: NADH:ubiquinone oxidoreductase subunit NDUFA12 [Alphaproteobacteria bacterium]|nr:NADH:ubiquinone oxidoreductase subunit NDUFA12 [Alphaproteobacteria bacterium]
MGFLDRIKLKFAYNMVGRDIYGNKYYQSHYCDKKGAFKRVVKYKGIIEPTKVPPMWHAWLHGLKDEAPSAEETQIEGWQKEHLPNLTGIKNCITKTNKPASNLSVWKISEEEADYEQQ